MSVKRWQELGFYLENSGELSSSDKKRPKEMLDKISDSEENMYAEYLSKLETYFTSEEEIVFYRAFSYAYWETFYKWKNNKKRFWNIKSLILPVVGVGGGGAARFTGFFSRFSVGRYNKQGSFGGETVSSETLKQIASNFWGVVSGYWVPCLGILIAWIVARLSLVSFREELKRRDYRETWVRHCITYHGLNTLMVRFLSAPIKNKKLYQ